MDLRTQRVIDCRVLGKQFMFVKQAPELVSERYARWLGQEGVEALPGIDGLYAVDGDRMWDVFSWSDGLGEWRFHGTVNSRQLSVFVDSTTDNDS